MLEAKLCCTNEFSMTNYLKNRTNFVTLNLFQGPFLGRAGTFALKRA
jgi:hypothetical protein